jgi:hypothetical protein
MTEPAEGDSAETPAPTEAAIPDPNPSDEQADTEPEPTPNSEAARWRTKLRDVEAVRDALTERLTGYQRRECESAVADLLEEPGDLWEIGRAELGDFYGDDGTLNEAELRAAAGALCEMRPKLAKPQGPRWQDFGQGSRPVPQGGADWQGVLKG